MNTCLKGNLGESKVLAKLIEHGWEVFTPFSGHTPFDLIGVHPQSGQLYRISVKSCFGKTERESYEIRLVQVRMSVNGAKVANFDSSSCDLVACYLGEIDEVCFVPVSEITTKTCLTFRESETKANITSGKIRFIKDYTSPPS